MNWDALLTPLSDENPAGTNMEYESVYEEIRQARESDPDYLPQDEWSTALRRADWPKVVRLCTQVLNNSSKDLQIASWLVEGCCQQQGLKGAVRGVNFLCLFIARYWENGWPLLDDDGAVIRHAVLKRLDRQMARYLTCLPLLGQPESTLEYWKKVLAHEHQTLMGRDPSPDEEGEDYAMETYQRWMDRQRDDSVSAVDALLQEFTQSLQRVVEQYQQVSDGEQGAVMGETVQVVSELQIWLGRISERIIPVSADGINGLEPDTHPQTSGALSGDAHRQRISREQAISQMLAIAHFFRQTEPSSPVPFLMERAARWANMTLTEWLEEMLQDDNSLQGITNVLTGPEQE